jgi:hypothetical protein
MKNRKNNVLPFPEGRASGSIKKDVRRKSSPASWKPRKVSMMHSISTFPAASLTAIEMLA